MLAKRVLGIHFSLTCTHFGRELNMLNLDTHIHFAFGLVNMLSARSRGARILDLLQKARLFIRRQSGCSPHPSDNNDGTGRTSLAASTNGMVTIQRCSTASCLQRAQAGRLSGVKICAHIARICGASPWRRERKVAHAYLANRSGARLPLVRCIVQWGLSLGCIEPRQAAKDQQHDRTTRTGVLNHALSIQPPPQLLSRLEQDGFAGVVSQACQQADVYDDVDHAAGRLSVSGGRTEPLAGAGGSNAERPCHIPCRAKTLCDRGSSPAGYESQE